MSAVRPELLLVHGAWHGAWCWGPLVAALRRRGVRATAVDLPGHGARQGEPASLSGYVDAVVEALGRFEAPPVLVGHSMGGMVITAAAEAAPERIAALAYVCAFLPTDAERLADLIARGPPLAGLVVDRSGRISRIPPDPAAALFFHDCPDAAGWAAQVQPQEMGVALEPVRLTERSRSVPRLYVRCRGDRAIPWALQTAMASRAEPIEVHDMTCGHSPFLSAPEELSELLVDVTGRCAAGGLDRSRAD